MNVIWASIYLAFSITRPIGVQVMHPRRNIETQSIFPKSRNIVIDLFGEANIYIFEP